MATVVSTSLLMISLLTALPPGLVVDPPSVRLGRPDDAVQLGVTGRDVEGRPVDLTHDPRTRFESENPSVAVVDRSGEVRVVGDGTTRIRVTTGDGLSVTVPVLVTGADSGRPVRFAAEVVPVLTKHGCNAGTCHGKSSGQNGFRLSLLGSDPAADYESLAREGRGRRVFPAAPGESLVLRKPTARIPHGGGRRLEPGSPGYRTISRWIGQGMPFDPEREPKLIALEVRPAARVVPGGGGQQLRVVARYGDGTDADVTRWADFTTTAPGLIAVEDRGRVRALEGVGGGAVVARFGGLVAVARVTVPAAGATAWEPPPTHNLVDRHVFGYLKALDVPPAAACDDATFARRSSLDILGALPDPSEVEALEKDRNPAKRARWVDRLLDRPQYADRFAMLWGAVLRNTRRLGRLSQSGSFALHAWVREALAENRPYDEFAAALLTAQGDARENPPVVWYRNAATAEDLADLSAPLFLGVRLQCARCHHHPTERWGRDDYEGFAAFFRRVGRKPGPDPATPQVFVTDTVSDVSPRFLGAASALDIGPGDDPRAALAAWLGRPDNPYFARAVVNRYWAVFFGRGLVEPEDDIRASNPPLVPGLLDALAEDFVRHGYDLKRLVRTIASSQTYALSSDPGPGSVADLPGLSRFAPRRLPAEVLLDAIDTVCGTSESFSGLPPGTRAVQLPDEAADTPGRFLDTFGRPKRETTCGCERLAAPGLAQSLHLLNSAEIERKVSHLSGRAAVWAAEPRPDAERVAELYRLALSRRPTDEERAACLAHLRRRRAEGRLRQGYEDLIWAVVNTKEFGFVE